MTNFLIILGVTQSLLLIHWLYVMISSEAVYKNGRNRLEKNWNEGGNILLLIYIISGAILSAGVYVALLKLNILINVNDYLTK